jgi:hypothetical protein
MSFTVSSKYLVNPERAASTRRSIEIASFLEARSNLQRMISEVTSKESANEPIEKVLVQSI